MSAMTTHAFQNVGPKPLRGGRFRMLTGDVFRRVVYPVAGAALTDETLNTFPNEAAPRRFLAAEVPDLTHPTRRGILSWIGARPRQKGSPQWTTRSNK
jgi:hypothetical protein